MVLIRGIGLILLCSPVSSAHSRMAVPLWLKSTVLKQNPVVCEVKTGVAAMADCVIMSWLAPRTVYISLRDKRPCLVSL